MSVSSPNIGDLAAKVWVTGGEAIAKGTAGKAVRDAYSVLKDSIQEMAPQATKTDFDLVAAIAKELNQQSNNDLAKVQKEAVTLADALALELPTRNIDINLRELNTILAQLKEVNLFSNSDNEWKVGNITVTGSGNIVVGGNRSGIEPVEPWPQPGKLNK